MKTSEADIKKREIVNDNIVIETYPDGFYKDRRKDGTYKTANGENRTIQKIQNNKTGYVVNNDDITKRGTFTDVKAPPIRQNIKKKEISVANTEAPAKQKVAHAEPKGPGNQYNFLSSKCYFVKYNLNE